MRNSIQKEVAIPCRVSLNHVNKNPVFDLEFHAKKVNLFPEPFDKKLHIYVRTKGKREINVPPQCRQ